MRCRLPGLPENPATSPRYSCLPQPHLAQIEAPNFQGTKPTRLSRQIALATHALGGGLPTPRSARVSRPRRQIALATPRRAFTLSVHMPTDAASVAALRLCTITQTAG